MGTGTCLYCQHAFTGRLGKKFCNDHCRVAYHATQKRDELVAFTKINKLLYKNREILKSLCPENKATVMQAELEWRGFNFKYHTNIYHSKSGGAYFFCYDYGYLVKADKNILIVKQEL